MTSELVIAECGAGDASAASKRLNALLGIPLLDITTRSLELAKGLVVAGIIPTRASEDALHISIATVHFVDYLLTWNCRHIAPGFSALGKLDVKREIRSHETEKKGMPL